MIRWIAVGVTLAAVITLATAQDQGNETADNNAMEMMSMEEDTSEERRKKNGMAQMYMAAMMFKQMIGTFYQTISTIIQVKSFGLTVIGTLINLARFGLQLKRHLDSKNEGGSGGGMFGGGDNRRVVTVAPPPHWLHQPYPYKSK